MRRPARWEYRENCAGGVRLQSVPGNAFTRLQLLSVMTVVVFRTRVAWLLDYPTVSVSPRSTTMSMPVSYALTRFLVQLSPPDVALKAPSAIRSASVWVTVTAGVFIIVEYLIAMIIGDSHVTPVHEPAFHLIQGWLLPGFAPNKNSKFHF